MTFAYGGVGPEPGPVTGADLDLRPGQVLTRVQHQGTGVRADVEHDARLATRAQGPFGFRAGPLVLRVVTVVMRVPVMRVLVMRVPVMVARAHRQLAGTRKPLWGTPRYGNEER